MLIIWESCHALAWVPFHCGPGNREARKRRVAVGNVRPICLVSHHHATGGDEDGFWREMKKGCQGATQPPSQGSRHDKEVHHWAGLRTVGFRGAWRVAARCRMLLASSGVQECESWMSLSSHCQSLLWPKEIHTNTRNRSENCFGTLNTLYLAKL